MQAELLKPRSHRTPHDHQSRNPTNRRPCSRRPRTAMKEAAWYRRRTACGRGARPGPRSRVTTNSAARACLPLQEARRQRGLRTRSTPPRAIGRRCSISVPGGDRVRRRGRVSFIEPNGGRCGRPAAPDRGAPARGPRCCVVCREPVTPALGLVTGGRDSAAARCERANRPARGSSNSPDPRVGAQPRWSGSGDAAIEGLDPGLSAAPSGSTRFVPCWTRFTDHERLHQAVGGRAAGRRRLNAIRPQRQSSPLGSVLTLTQPSAVTITRSSIRIPPTRAS